MAALVPVGTATMARGNGKAVLAVACVLIVAQAGAAVFVKIPAHATYWVDGYFDVVENVRRDAAVVVAAPEIGAVGWRAWPASILDLEGLISPESVGVPQETLLKSKRPDYLIVRTDNSAVLLRVLDGDPWFSDTYEVIAVRRDPYADREFRSYRRKSRE